MDDEEALAAAMAKLGLPSAFRSSQAGYTVTRTAKTSRTVTTICRSDPHSHARSTDPSNDHEASTSVTSHNSGLSSSSESVQFVQSVQSVQSVQAVQSVKSVLSVDTEAGHPWRAIWDSLYDTVYYYNTVSCTSQWEPPHDVSTSDIPYDVSTQGSSLHEQPLQEEREGEGEGPSEEAVSSGNGSGSQIYYAQAMSSTEATEVYTHAEKQSVFPSSMSEAAASVTAMTAESETGDAWKRSKAKKKQKKKKKGAVAVSNEAQQLMSAYASEDVPGADWGIIAKYWKRRYSLFSRFDAGIRMDTEAWYSVTPEEIAVHQAQRCACDVIVDAFTGCGGNAIQFALTCKRVIAIDIDPKKIELARHNASVYGVDSKIEFLVGDFLQLAPQLKADVVFLSPPWGGPGYGDVEEYDLDTMLMPCPGPKLFQLALGIAQDVALFVPRNSNQVQLEELAWLACPIVDHDVELNLINERVKGLTAYYGSISKSPI